MVAVGVLDQSENRHRVVGSGLQAFADERSAGVRSLAGEPCERFQTTMKQLGAEIAGRGFRVRQSVSFV